MAKSQTQKLKSIILKEKFDKLVHDRNALELRVICAENEWIDQRAKETFRNGENLSGKYFMAFDNEDVDFEIDFIEKFDAVNLTLSGIIVSKYEGDYSFNLYYQDPAETKIRHLDTYGFKEITKKEFNKFMSESLNKFHSFFDKNRFVIIEKKT